MMMKWLPTFLMIILASPAPGMAAGPQFDPSDIIKGVEQYYSWAEELSREKEDAAYMMEDDDLTCADGYLCGRSASLESVGRYLAEQITLLKPVHFNSVIALLMKDYHTRPGHRPSIETLIANVHALVEPELRRNREKHPVLTVMGDVITVWSGLYAFNFGRGLWAARTQGLRGIREFQRAVQATHGQLAPFKRSALKAAKYGTLPALSHALYQQLETRKVNPRDLLQHAQANVLERCVIWRTVTEKYAVNLKSTTVYRTRNRQVCAASSGLAREVAGLRGAVEQIPLEQVRRNPERYKAMISVLTERNISYQNQVLHLRESAGFLQKRLEPVAIDLLATSSLLGGLLQEISPSDDLRMGSFLPPL